MEEITLRAGHYLAVITPVGGGLRVLEYQGNPLTESYPAATPAPLSAGVCLAPWPNRVGDGVFNFHGHSHQLQITEPERNNAIHGFVAGRRFEVEYAHESEAKLTIVIEPQEGWPWRMWLSLQYALDAKAGLQCRMSVENQSAQVAPFAAGMHTYLSAHGAAIDECTVQVPAAKILPLDPVRNLPCGPVVALEDYEHDVVLNHRLLDGLWLDYPYTDLATTTRVDTSGKSHDVIEHVVSQGAGKAVKLWTDPAFGWVQVFSADPAKDCGYPGKGRALAIEPMTAPPDALRSGIDLIELAPGAFWSACFGLVAA